jgi:peptidoglycan/xylan/chitin deacetylase (PgdA/CDA1 family)
VRLPILMYHYLSDPPAGADRYRRDLSVPPELFEQHLAYLKAQGYQTVSLDDLTYALAQGRPLPAGDKSILITFDDGYLDNYQNAFPLLQKYGFTGVFFVVTELAERASAGLAAPNGLPYADVYMSWDQLREMAATGMEVECHARVHEDLTENDDARLVWQVLGCREMIESALGIRPRYVAYPSGIYDARVASVFASDGYWGGITTEQGIIHDSSHPFELKRLRVRNTTTPEVLAELLAWNESEIVR